MNQENKGQRGGGMSLATRRMGYVIASDGLLVVECDDDETDRQTRGPAFEHWAEIQFHATAFYVTKHNAFTGASRARETTWLHFIREKDQRTQHRHGR
jgi:hypothetical protein